MSLIDQALPYVRSHFALSAGRRSPNSPARWGIPVEKIVKLASNENPLGMSPKAKAAMEKTAGTLSRYPDDFDLKKALSNHTGLDINRIVLGNGSNDVLDLIARVFLARAARRYSRSMPLRSIRWRRSRPVPN